MLAVIAKLNVKEGSEAAFEEVMLDLAAKVNTNEPGCHLYTLCKDADGNYTVMELYEDEAAVHHHVNSDHLKAAGPRFKGIMAGPPEIQRYEVLEQK